MRALAASHGGGEARAHTSRGGETGIAGLWITAADDRRDRRDGGVISSEAATRKLSLDTCAVVQDNLEKGAPLRLGRVLPSVIGLRRDPIAPSSLFPSRPAHFL